ncbi:response regulator [Dyadobacter luticola]|uniref:histidine kinase n=1 Tax=Dyadobacter luticola TaxID=1979387 RepID=A0A5R9L6H3_9BACT|nr:response regulator [Dyadobacter luticola]
MKYTFRTLVLFLQIFIFGAACHLSAQPVSFPKAEVISAKQGLPQGFIPGIVQDAQGMMWIATRNGLCRYDAQHIKVFHQASPDEPSLSSLGLESLKPGTDKKIWVLTDQGALDLFDPFTETLVNYSRQAFFQKAFGKRLIKSIFPDRQNRLWFVSDTADLAMVNVKTRQIRRFWDEKNNAGLVPGKVRDIAEGRDGSLWFAARKGIFILPKNTTQLTRYVSADPTFKKIETNTYALTERPDGAVLLLSKQGISKLDPHSGKLTHYPLPPDQKSEYEHSIVLDSKANAYFFRMTTLFRFNDADGVQAYPLMEEGFSEFKSLYIDHSDVLWAGTNGQGVRKFNLRAAYFTTLPYRESFVPDLLRQCLKLPESQVAMLPENLFSYNFRYTYDKAQNLWFSCGQTPFYKVNFKDKTMETVSFPVNIARSERSEMAISLATDPDGRIWALYDSLLVYYENGRWQDFEYPVRPGIESATMQLVADREALWVATSNRGLYRIDRTSGQIRRFGHIAGNPNSLNNDNVYCLFADPQNPDLLWLGTFGGGLSRFDKRTGLFKNITSQDGLPNDVVYTAIPDHLGNVWAGTNQGLAQVNAQTFKIRIYTREDGLLADEFNRFHALQLPDGRIFLGGIEGITGFDPRKSYVDHFQPATLITGILINNTPIENNRAPVTAIEELDLDFNQNFLTVEFAAMQYNRSDKIRYRYQLAGLDEHWIETGNPVTKYTDLRPGHYILRLNASNTEGMWSSQVRTLKVVIHPPWWQTWWAYILYAIGTATLIYWFLRAYTNRLKLRQSFILKQKELELIDKESRQLRELDEMKTRFFSNITHEFRTPLTLILTPVEQMLEENRKTEDLNRLGLIDRNAHQLLGLVNQLLDLSKLESGTMKVTESQSDLHNFVKELVGSFQDTADARHISLTYASETLATAYHFDHEKLERILNNLLSNALKFTPESGRVNVHLAGHSKGITLIISDSGSGIPSEKLDHVFERFYQVDSETGYRQGTGIGLAIVKELVEIQHGNVRVESLGKDLGTTFTVELPYRAAVLARQDAPVFDDNHLSDKTLDIRASNSDLKILLVEDHLELGDFIADNLGKHYQCYRAGNGEEALKIMSGLMPDLVVSDVMMPVMDGYTLCGKIKSDLQTSHIPVILLTAKSTAESKLEGLSLGADDYITKPFHLHELELRIRNTLERQRRLREMLHASFTDDKPAVIQPEKATDPFLTKLYNILDAQLENTDFGVNELIAEIGMSSSSLNRKLKALTDLSAVELIRNYRLKKAAEYLAAGTGISETAYLVGFDNLSYFAKCFRDLFKMSPRDFAGKVSS